MCHGLGEKLRPRRKREAGENVEDTRKNEDSGESVCGKALRDCAVVGLRSLRLYADKMCINVFNNVFY